MNTLEHRVGAGYNAEFILWPGESAQQVRDRLYPGEPLNPIGDHSVKRLSLGAGRYCRAWSVPTHSLWLVEMPS